MTNADNLNIFFLAAKELTDSFRLSPDGTSRSFLNKDVTILTMFESKQYEIHRLFQWHDEARHFRLGQRYRITIANLLYPERNDWTTGTHHVAITCTTNLGLAGITAFCHCYLFLNSFGDTHSIDWIGSLIRGKADYGTNTRLNSSRQYIVSTDYIRLDSFHWEKFATRNLLQGSSMEDIVYSRHSVPTRLEVTYITDKEFYFICHIRILNLIFVAHIVLFLLVGTKETIQDCITERTCSTGNH